MMWFRKPIYVAITAVLGYKASCHKSRKTINSPRGIADTLAAASLSVKYCVLEVCGGFPMHVQRSLRMFRPDIAVLLLIEREHIKSADNLQLIAAEKAKLVQALPENGVAVLNIDDPQVRAIGEALNRKIIWVGRDEKATVRLVEARSTWPQTLTLVISHEGRVIEVPTSLHGTHLAVPVICTIGVGLAAGLPMDEIIAALKTVEPAEGRMQIVDGGNYVNFIRDDWKAPLWSLHAPLAFLGDAKAERKIAVIGTLSDYSRSASKLYPKVAADALAVADLVIFTGDHALRAVKGKTGTTDAERLKAFPLLRDAADFLRTELRQGDLVLLKGSGKVDHLARLWMDRVKPVICWREKCDRNYFCNVCQLVSVPEPPKKVQVWDVAAVEDDAENDLRMSTPRLIVVGLGNDGAKYHQTRHNVGYMFVDWIVARARGTWRNLPLGATCDVDLEGLALRVFKPACLINNSGPPVQAFIERSGAAPSDCVFIHDDMDLNLGDVRTKDSGGDGGHRGMRSLILSLGTGDIGRLRIGVRPAGELRNARELVHDRFSDEEMTMLNQSFRKAFETLSADNRATSVARQPGPEVRVLSPRKASKL